MPAAVLTLLLELGAIPAELDIDRLDRSHLVAWEQAEPESRDSPALRAAQPCRSGHGIVAADQVLPADPRGGPAACRD